MKKILFLITIVIFGFSCKNENIQFSSITTDSTYIDSSSYIVIDSIELKTKYANYGKVVNGYIMKCDDYIVWNLYTNIGFKSEVLYRYNTYSVYFIRDYKVEEIKDEKDKNLIIKKLPK